VIIMLVGVTIFSYASGSVASIMTNLDEQEAIKNQRNLALASLVQSYSFSPQLVADIQESFLFETRKGHEDVNQLISGLPMWL
jgi:hypothetical protein